MEKRKLVKNNSMDTGIVNKGVASKLADGTVNNLISSAGKRDISGRQHSESSRQGKANGIVDRFDIDGRANKCVV